MVKTKSENKISKDSAAKPAKKSLVKKLVRKKEQTNVKIESNIKDPFGVIRFVHMTEKSIQLVERENKIVFIVARSASKSDIKTSVEKIFRQKVNTVKTVIDQKGRKKAFVKFSKEDSAGEIALQLGVI